MGKQSKIEIILSAKDTGMSSGIGKATKGLQGLQKEAETLKTKLSGLSTIKLAIGGIAGGAAAYYANEVRKIADEYTNLNSRLKLVTDGEQDLAMVREKLYHLSQETGTEYAANADGYSRLARAVRDLGGSSEEALQITELINKSLTVNGSTSAMAASFMLQFSQAMGKGKLDGDEFNGMLESNAYFANELAKALDTTMGGLFEMREAGELTADKLRAAFPKMAQTVSDEFSKISPTVERAMIMLENSFKRIGDESNRASDGTGSISKSVVNLAETIDRNRDGIISFFSKMIDLGAWTTKQVAGMGTEIEVIGQVAKGNLDFSQYITMTSVEEMHAWLKKNVQTLDETGQAAKQAGSEVTKAAQQSATTQKQVTGEALKEMKKQYQDFAKEIRQLQDDINGRGKSLAAELRDMGRSSMSDHSAWQDQKKEAQEYEAAAKKATSEAKAAMESGDTITAGAKWKEAIGLADQAKQSYKDLNQEVKNGDAVMISKQQALQTAMAGVKSAGELSISILKQQQAATVGAMNTLTKESGFANLAEGMTAAEQQWLTSWESMKNAAGEKINLVKKQIDTLGTSSEQVKEKMKDAFSDVFQPPEDGDWGKVWEAMESGSNKAAGTVTNDWDRVWDNWLASGSEKIDILKEQLTELTKDRHMKIYVEKVEKNRFGGLIGAYHDGGQVSRFARGGKLPGYGGGDKVRALLEPGEFVMRKEAVARYGVPFMQALNAMRLNDLSTIKARVGGLIDQANTAREQRFQQGGLATAGGSSETINLNLTLPGGSPAFPMTITKEHARQLLRHVNNMQCRSSK